MTTSQPKKKIVRSGEPLGQWRESEIGGDSLLPLEVADYSEKGKFESHRRAKILKTTSLSGGI